MCEQCENRMTTGNIKEKQVNQIINQEQLILKIGEQEIVCDAVDVFLTHRVNF